MFTVLIQNKKTCDSFYEHLPLFKGFLEDDDDFRQIEICEWNEAGKTIDEALPDLHRLTDDKPAWRAVIVRHEDEMPLGVHPRAHDNPYDFLDLPASEDPISPADNPLLALVESLANPLEYFDRSRMEQNHKPAAMEFNGVRPQTITLISVRHVDELLTLPKARYELEHPDFVQRNGYPSLCRFAVVDRFHQGPYRRMRDDFEFWNIVLMLATSRIDASFLEAYTLQALSLNLDAEAMQELWNDKYSQLVQADRLIEHHLEHQSVYLQKYEGPYPDYRIRIDGFDPLPDDLKPAIAPSRYLRLPVDPSLQAKLWKEESDQTRAEMNRQWEETPNELEKKVAALHKRKAYDESEVDVLSPLQQRKLRNELKELRLQLIREDSQLPKDGFTKKAELEEIQEDVRRELAGRMRRRQMLAWMAGLIGLCLIGLIPPWLASLGRFHGQQMRLLAAATVILILLPVVYLLWQTVEEKKIIRRSIEEWNGLMGLQFEQLNTYRKQSVDCMSDELSLYRGESYYQLAKKKVVQQKDDQRDLEETHKEIRRFLKRLNRWAAAFNLILTSTEPDLDDRQIQKLPLRKEEFKELFMFDPETGQACEINETGRKILAPFSFIRSLSIRVVGRRNPL